MDQAATLRQSFGRQKQPAPARIGGPRRGRMRVIAVTSGKGGVGKTNIVVNLCVALSRMGRRVFLLDADMGLANVDVLLGMVPRFTLEHVMSGQKELHEIVLEGPGGFKVLPASSGIGELSELGYEQQMQLFRALGTLDAEMDYLFIDTGAGISSNVLRFNASAHDVVLVANPEPTSITDAYALMKLLAIRYDVRGFNLIANSVLSEGEGHAVYERLNKVALQFLNVNLRYLGAVPLDKAIPKSVREQTPVLAAFPAATSSRAIARIAALIDDLSSAGVAAAQPGASAGAIARVSAYSAPSAAASAVQPDVGFWDRLLHWKRVK